MRTPNHYEVLGVARDASAADIRSAFRKLVKIYHPDRTPGVEGSRFRAIVNAYKILSNPRARIAYDRHLSSGGAHGEHRDTTK
jgi:molecular chaperone DnaJ